MRFKLAALWGSLMFCYTYGDYFGLWQPGALRDMGVVYAVIMLLTMRGAWMFYILLGIIEIVLTVLIIWQAWSWPKQLSDASPPAPHDN